MSNTIIYNKSNAKASSRLKRSILASALAFSIVFGSMENVFCVTTLNSDNKYSKTNKVNGTHKRKKKPIEGVNFAARIRYRFSKFIERAEMLTDDEKKKLTRQKLNDEILSKDFATRKTELSALKYFMMNKRKEYQDDYPGLFHDNKRKIVFNAKQNAREKGHLFITERKTENPNTKKETDDRHVDTFRPEILSIDPKDLQADMQAEENDKEGDLPSWYPGYKKEGDYKAKKRGGSKRKFNWQDAAEYVRKNPNVMLKELAKIFKASESSMYNCLDKQGFSCEKTVQSVWKQNNAKKKYI